MEKNNAPWLKHYDQEVPASLNYPEKTLYRLVRENITSLGEHTALLFSGNQLTYHELGKAIDSTASAFRDLGVSRGSRVALLLPNSPQYVIAFYAVHKLGGVVVPLNPLSPEQEIEHITRDAGVEIALVLDLLAGKINKVREKVSGGGLLRHVLYTSIADFLPFPLNVFYPLGQKLSPEAKQALRKGLKLSLLLGKREAKGDDGQVDVDVHRDPAVIAYTSGTTGYPKGVILSHYALVVNALQVSAWAGMGPEDRLLAVLPVFHGFGMSVCMNAPLVTGASVVLVPRFQPEKVLKTISNSKPTLFAGVPTMYTALINQKNFSRHSLESLRGCFVGAAPLPAGVKRKFEQLTGSRLMEGYGLTEAVTAKCANPYRGLNKEGSIGIPFPDTFFKIVDPETGENELAPGETGEIIISSPDIMLGYHNLPGETSQTVRDGWLYTGDLGRMDDDGFFYITDRKKDLIITGGFNVYPREVEDVLYTHPSVQDACVVGIPDEYRGEKVWALVVPGEGMEINTEELKAFCREQLTPYKVPREIEIRNSLPKNAIGKVLRKELRQELENTEQTTG